MSSLTAATFLLERHHAGELALDALIAAGRYPLDELNRTHDDTQSGLNIRGAITF
jgi:Zn-dependent alcohol dehydrogenase